MQGTISSKVESKLHLVICVQVWIRAIATIHINVLGSINKRNCKRKKKKAGLCRGLVVILYLSLHNFPITPSSVWRISVARAKNTLRNTKSFLLIVTSKRILLFASLPSSNKQQKHLELKQFWSQMVALELSPLLLWTFAVVLTEWCLVWVRHHSISPLSSLEKTRVPSWL